MLMTWVAPCHITRQQGHIRTTHKGKGRHKQSYLQQRRASALRILCSNARLLLSGARAGLQLFMFLC